jgi:hypothetical protein
MAILQGWDTNETTGARAGGGVGPTREAGVGGTRGRRARMRVGVAGSVGRPAHRLVRPLGPGDGPMDPSPWVIYSIYIQYIYET